LHNVLKELTYKPSNKACGPINQKLKIPHKSNNSTKIITNLSPCMNKIKNLKRKMCKCTAVNNTGNKLNDRNLNKK
jgi:hypothetical protein